MCIFSALPAFPECKWRIAGFVPATINRQRPIQSPRPKLQLSNYSQILTQNSFRLAEPKLAALFIRTPSLPPAFILLRRGSHRSRFAASNGWRRGRDSNPRWAFTQSGFQDRRDRPLCHLSAIWQTGLPSRSSQLFLSGLRLQPAFAALRRGSLALASLRAQAGTAGGT